MKFEIPFDENIFRKQMALHFQNAWKSRNKKMKSVFFFGLFLTAFGSFAFSSGENNGIIGLIIGISSLFVSIIYFFGFRQSKSSFYKTLETDIVRYQKSEQNNLWEFNDFYFHFLDFRYEIKIGWKEFKSFDIIDKNLFLFLDDKKEQSFILGESQIGNENFEKVVNFMKDKIAEKS